MVIHLRTCHHSKQTFSETTKYSKYIQKLRDNVGGLIDKLYELGIYSIDITCCYIKMERETRLELATSTLARWRSTTELFPLNFFEYNL